MRRSRPPTRRTSRPTRNAKEAPKIQIAKHSAIDPTAKLIGKVKLASLIAGPGAVLENVVAYGLEAHVGANATLREVTSAGDGMLEVGEGADLQDVVIEEDARAGSGAFVTIEERASVRYVYLDLSKVGAGSELHGTEYDFLRIDDSTIGPRTRISGRTRIRSSEIGADANLEDVTLTKATIGEGSRVFAATIDGALFHGKAGRGVGIGQQAKVGHNGPVTLAEHVVIKAFATVGAGTKVGDRSAIGAYCEIKDNVTIGSRVRLSDYVIVEAGVTIGDEAQIESGNVISEDVPAGAQIRRPELALATGEPVLTVQADAESWKLGRLAEIVEKSGGRLDKRVLQKEHPQLVETVTVKNLLRGKPPTGAELREMAKAFEKHPKYDVYFVPGGWSGIQVIGRYSNDVLLFDVHKDVVAALAEGYPFPVLPRLSPGLPESYDPGVEFVHAVIRFGRGEAHPGGERPRNIGWARVRPYAGYKSMLVEELQTDLTVLAFDPARELRVVWENYRSHLHQIGVQRPLQCLEPVTPTDIRVARSYVAPVYGDEPLDASAFGFATDHVHGHLRTAFRAVAEMGNDDKITPTGWPWENAIALVGLFACSLPESAWPEYIALGEPGEYGYRPPLVDAMLLNAVAAELIMETLHTKTHAGMFSSFAGADWERDVFRGREGRSPALAELVRSIAARNRVDTEPRSEAWLAIKEHDFEHPVFQLIRRDAEAIVAKAQQVAQWAVETVKLIREMFADVYEAMLAGILALSRQQGLTDVWLLDYGTKYALAAYEGLEPPRSVYTDLPKKFQVAPVQKLPGYMDTRRYEIEREERLTLPRAKEMPQEPMGRRLIPNQASERPRGRSRW